MHASEDALAVLGCERASTLKRPRVLVGGLGMGFTLRAALDILPPAGLIVVAELVPEVVEWNRGPLGLLAKHPLRDPRITIDECDVAVTMRSSPGYFDAVLLDVDNGPASLTASSNDALYDREGIATARASLRPRGTLAVWSANDNRRYEPIRITAGRDTRFSSRR
jgi:spermidine synthase